MKCFKKFEDGRITWAKMLYDTKLNRKPATEDKKYNTNSRCITKAKAKTKKEVKIIYLPSDLLTEVISLFSAGTNFGDRGAGVVLILVKPVVL